MSEPQSITYADLRDDDVLIDKSGGRWHVSGVVPTVLADVPHTEFWLGDVRTKVRVHHMTKPAGDPCTVDCVETLRDTVEKLEAEWSKPEEFSRVLGEDPWETERLEALNHQQAVDNLVSDGAKVDTDSTAAEVDAAAKATEDDPVILPLFESMTTLEQRSHLFVLHGLFCDDMDDSKTLSETHTKATIDRAQLKLRSLYKPHEHSAEVK